jgi:predicted Zn finger-like uncharacterized protein
MRIVCPQCGAKYEVKDEKVRKKVFKIRCKRCTHEFVVRGEQEEAQEPAAAQVADEAAPAPAATNHEDEATKVVDYSERQREIAEEEGAVWHVVINREQVGGLTADDVLAYLGRGEIDPDTFTWREGMADWARLSTVPEFADAVAHATAQAEPDAQDDLGATAAIDIGAGIPEPASNDAEEDVMASNNVADGTAGGLFGGIDDLDDPRVSDPSQLRNQRNENSVLFSLDALAEGAGASPRSAPAPQVANTGGSEASGLIDMSLLDNVGPGPLHGTQSEMDALFGAGSGPAAAMPMPTGAPIQPLVNRKKSKLPMILGIAAGILILVGGTAVVMMQVMDKGETTATVAGATTPTKSPAKFKIGGEDKPKAASVEAAPKAKEAADAPAAAAIEKVAGTTPAAPTAAAKPAGKASSKRSGRSSRRASKPKKSVKRSGASGLAANSAKPTPRPAAKPKPRRASKKSGGSDEVDDLLGALDGKPAARPTGNSGRRPSGRSESTDPADDPLLPDKLGRKEIMSTVRRGIGKVLNCKAGTGASGTIKVRLTVAKTGRVQKAKVISSNFQGTPVGRCVEGKVKAFRFPAFRQGPMSFNMPFKL